MLAVAVGGALGSVLRYVVALWLKGPDGQSGLPWGTFVVNVGGSLLLGVLAAMAWRTEGASPTVRLLLMTGFCGGLTTYSTFNLETLKLIESGKIALAAINAGGTFAVCLAAGFGGLALGRALWATPAA